MRVRAHPGTSGIAVFGRLIQFHRVLVGDRIRCVPPGQAILRPGDCSCHEPQWVVALLRGESAVSVRDSQESMGVELLSEVASSTNCRLIILGGLPVGPSYRLKASQDAPRPAIQAMV